VPLRYIDFSRAVLFSLGIVLHAAWLCKGRSPAFAAIHDFIHSFRMESFFLIAGFFSGMTLTKGPPELFLRNRLKRLFIPLLFCGVALNTALHCALRHEWHDFSFLLTSSYWLSGEWLAHLWFIGTLFLYVLLLYGLHKLCPKVHFIFRSSIWNVVTVLVGVAMLRRVLTVMAGHSAIIESGTLLIAHGAEVLEYIAFFMAGYLLFYRQDILDNLINMVPINAASVVLFWSLMGVLDTSVAGRQILNLWRGIYSVQVCALIFWMARSFFNRPNSVITALSEASYTIYLVHWPLMAVIYWLIAPTHMPVVLLFSLLVISTAVLSYEIHNILVSRSYVLSLLMNGHVRHPTKRPEPFCALNSASPVASR
jgi:glucan biosynthesis protein C